MAIDRGATPVSGTGTSVTINSTTAGRRLMIGLIFRDTGDDDVPSVTCTGEDIVLLGSLARNLSTDYTVGIYTIKSLATGGNKQINVDTAGTERAIYVAEYTETDTSVNGGTPVSKTGSLLDHDLSITTTAANSLIFALLVTGSVPAVNPPTGYSTVASQPFYDYSFCYDDTDSGAVGARTIVFDAGGNTSSLSIAVEIPQVSALPPDAPTVLAPGALTTTGATCYWNDVTGETGYDVEVAASPYSSWSAVSGSPTAAGVTSLAATGLSNATNYKFRVRSKNANGDSSWVESAVFLTQTPVKLRPASDITVGSWTSSLGGALYAALDETSPDDGDFVSITGTGTFEVKLGPAVDPAVSYGHTIRYRLQGDGAKTFTARLVQGTTIRSTDPTVRVPAAGSWTTYSWTLTAGEADAITDYTDLRVRITVA